MTNFEPPFFLRYLIDVSYHVAEYAHITWEPWTDGSKTYIGWEGIPFDQGQPHIYVYLVVDADATKPTIAVYAGNKGDPEKDTQITVVSDAGQ